jgi:hypothetical protein
LVVLRGNSGSGKSSTALALRAGLGRKLAIVEQDMFRRLVLDEPDVPDGATIGLISLNVRYALDNGFDVVVEGIMNAKRYSDMLAALAAEHRGTTAFYYFDVSLDETQRRHATRAKALQFGVEEMRGWYEPRDLLPFVAERVIAESATLAQTVERIRDEVFRAVP